MNLYLYRRVKLPTYTIGRLYEGVQRVCDTLEDAVRELIDLNGDGDFNDPGEGKVYGKTAIPAGKYELKMLMSPTFRRLMPYLQDVPGFTSIMIHPGNFADFEEYIKDTSIDMTKKILTFERIKVV